MKRDIDCIGFEAPDDVVHFMREIMTDLQTMSPYESYIEAKLSKEGSDFVIELSIRHVDGEFVATGKGRDMKDVVAQAATAITDQVRKWTESRILWN